MFKKLIQKFVKSEKSKNEKNLIKTTPTDQFTYFEEEMVEFILQEDILLNLIPFFTLKELLELSLCCHHLQTLTFKNERAWKVLCVVKFKLPEYQIIQCSSWKKIYMKYSKQFIIYGKDFEGNWVGEHWKKKTFEDFKFEVLTLEKSLYWFEITGIYNEMIPIGKYYGYLCVNSHMSEEIIDCQVYFPENELDEKHGKKILFNTSGFTVYKIGPFDIAKESTFKLKMINTQGSLKVKFSVSWFLLCYEFSSLGFERNFLKVKKDMFVKHKKWPF